MWKSPWFQTSGHGQVGVLHEQEHTSPLPRKKEYRSLRTCECGVWVVPCLVLATGISKAVLGQSVQPKAGAA